jgi:PAS domain S-box-containing protein
LQDEPRAPAGHESTVRSDPRRIGRNVRAWPLGWLLYLFALALIAPLLGFGLFATSRLIVAERADGEEQLRRITYTVSAAIDRELKDIIEELQALAASSELREGDLASFHRYASAVLLGTGKGIMLVDRELNQLVNTRVSYGTPLPRFHDPETARTVFATAKPAIGGLVLSRVAHRHVINIVVPAIINGGLRYALVLSPDPATLRRILEQHYLPEGWLAGVSDQNGRILARSARHEEFVGTPISARTKSKSTARSGVIKTTSREGDVVLQAYLWSHVSGWRTAVWVPLAILEAPARQLWLALAALAVPAFALSLLAAALLGRWLARPIAGVANAAAALGRADPVGYAPCAIAEVNVVGATLAAAAEQRRRAEAALKESGRRLRLALDIAAIGHHDTDLAAGTAALDEQAMTILGLSMSVLSVEDAWKLAHPDDRAAVEAAAALALDPAARRTAATEHRIIRPDGELRWLHWRGRAVFDENTSPPRPLRLVGVMMDITERKRAEEHVRFLMRELSHRTKNVMAVVQAISWQTAKKSLDLGDFEQRFTKRLEALARSHDLLVRRDWRGVVLEDLVRAQLEPFLDSAKERLAVDGPVLLLMPIAAQDLGLALHELATNASKYGALSVPAGKIDIRWTIDNGTASGKHFYMTWRESGGPMVSPQVRKGFGFTVTTSSLSRSFNGEAKLDYRPEGLSWELAAPLGQLITEAS